jgi:hypothetical protein
MFKRIIPLIQGGMSIKNRRENQAKTIGFMRESIESHKKSFQENSARDFIDVYLGEIKKTEDRGSSFFGKEGGRDKFLSHLAF